MNVIIFRVITKSIPVGETHNLYEDNQQFKKWLKKQETLKQNILKVCEKYGSSLRKMMPLNQFMYDSEHNLLFCRNAKVWLFSKNYPHRRLPLFKIVLLGWNNNLVDKFFDDVISASSPLWGGTHFRQRITHRCPTTLQIANPRGG